MFIGIVSAETSSAQSIKVVVLDALDGKPQPDVRVYYLCDEIPHSVDTYVVTDVTGIAEVHYPCHPGVKIELSAVPKSKKEGCGGGVEAAIGDIESTGLISSPDSAGGIWCPTKVSRRLKPNPGRVTLFIKKPTWWQSHIAG